MDLNLTRKLIEKGVIKPATELEAHYDAIDLSGMHCNLVHGAFVVMAIGEDAVTKEPLFEVASVVTGRRKRLRCAAITSVDGMEPPRLASIYDIRSDGSDRPPGKRRGRKPRKAKEGT